MSQASTTIDNYLAGLPAWQATNLSLFRKLIHQTEPVIAEDWKWNVPVFTLGGKMIFSMAAFKNHTKFNFILNGALLNDSDGIFNNGLESKKSRSIDLKQDNQLAEASLVALMKQAIALANTPTP